jgi:hypothetical protein
MRCDKDETWRGHSSYQAELFKDSEDTQSLLTLQIVAPNNGTVLKEASTKAPFGAVIILGDC